MSPTTPRADGVELVLGDITLEHVDAIVNAADPSLLGGGGVDGAIHAAAGPDLLDACRALRDTDWPDGLPAGEAAWTLAGDLPCRYVIHTVGPDRRRGQTDPAVLASCFRRSLELASELGCSSVALPAVGAGVFGWDAAEVARVAAAATLGHHRDGVATVRFVLHTQEVLQAFEEAFERAAAPEGGRLRAEGAGA